MKHYTGDFMSVFIDTNIFVALRNADDINHKKAKKLMKKALTGKLGVIYTSEYIFNEAVTVALIRTKNIKIAIDIGNYILSSPRIKLLFIDDEIFKKAWKIFQKYKEKRLSFTDCTTIALIEKHKIDKLMSFDQHFNEIVQRIQ